MTTIAFIHHGDRTGNTASCLNIAGCLQRSGNRVLVLDLDPEEGVAYGPEAGRTSLVIDVSDVFVRGRNINGGGRFLSALDIKDIPTKPGTGIDPVSATLKQGFASAKDKYDYILIDTPHSMEHFVVNGTIAADHTILTVDRGAFAIEGSNASEIVTKMIPEYDGHPKIMMTILTNTAGRLLSDLVPFYDSRATCVRSLKRMFCSISFKTVVSYSEAVHEAQSHGLPISHYAPDSAAGKTYKTLTEEIMSIDRANQGCGDASQNYAGA